MSQQEFLAMLREEAEDERMNDPLRDPGFFKLNWSTKNAPLTCHHHHHYYSYYLSPCS